MTRLFIIDDHAVLREALRGLLEASGHEVVGDADEPTRGVSEMARLRPEVLVLDLHLGNRSGFEVLADIARRQLDVKVVVLSTSDQPRDVAEAMRLGAQGYVLKGASSVELLQAIAAASNGETYFSEGCAARAVQGLTDQQTNGTDVLSPRERQILVMVARGASSSKIGDDLHLSPKTIDTYRSRLMAKLGLNDVPAIVRWCIRQGLTTVDER